MNNKQVAGMFDELAKLMELHGENPFKIRSYQTAYRNIRKLGSPILELPAEEISDIKGIGKAISAKIAEIKDKGSFETLERYRAMTPEGIVEMLSIKGFGPKKIKVVWDELGITSPGELHYACSENRLVDLPGFGVKTQEDLQKRLDYYLKTKNRFLFATLEPYANLLLDRISSLTGIGKVEFTGDYRRKCETLEMVELIASGDLQKLKTVKDLSIQLSDSGYWVGSFEGTVPVIIYPSEEGRWGFDQFNRTGPEQFVLAFQGELPNTVRAAGEEELFTILKKEYVPPEIRDNERALEWADGRWGAELIRLDDIRGLIHCHSTWSDGLHTIEDMAGKARELGLEYMVLSDHSKSAFYADGLSEERVKEQWQEIDRLNSQYDDFRIFRGIESDILADGGLDYDEEILNGFDLVIASVHSNLRMDLEKASRRLIRAVENPHTRILGHPTGRLLLSRPGYPVDWDRLIDACEANGVVIELNANPYRLDIDWRFIQKAVQKGVLISINPDAHSMEGIKDIHYGVLAARKGGLSADYCLNALGRAQFENFLEKVNQ